MRSSPILPIPQEAGNSTAEPLPGAFYLPPPEVVAQKLLGKLLLRQLDGHLLATRIVETEAYLGGDDPAAHAFRGMTGRNSVLFGPAGRAYVYFIYGMYFCLNVSCEAEGKAGCVLIRALEPLTGTAEMARRRRLPADSPQRMLTSGPGKLCQALGITRQLCNDLDLTVQSSGLWIADDGFRSLSTAVTPRIGISKAADRPLRFFISGNPFVSASRVVSAASPI